jgi:hypothetical protein
MFSKSGRLIDLLFFKLRALRTVILVTLKIYNLIKARYGRHYIKVAFFELLWDLILPKNGRNSKANLLYFRFFWQNGSLWLFFEFYFQPSFPFTFILSPIFIFPV